MMERKKTEESDGWPAMAPSRTVSRFPRVQGKFGTQKTKPAPFSDVAQSTRHKRVLTPTPDRPNRSDAAGQRRAWHMYGMLYE